MMRERGRPENIKLGESRNGSFVACFDLMATLKTYVKQYIRYSDSTIDSGYPREIGAPLTGHVHI